MTDKKLQVIPIGGLGEFGMNMTAIRFGDDIIIVDCGMMFPEAELLGVDLVMPDLTFLKENQEFVRGVILTHGHEDHIGAVPYFLSEINVPVYGTDFTLALVDRRLEEYDLEEEPRFVHVKPRQVVEIGPFKIEFIHVTHSIVNAVALAITTPLGVISGQTLVQCLNMVGVSSRPAAERPCAGRPAPRPAVEIRSISGEMCGG